MKRVCCVSFICLWLLSFHYVDIATAQQADQQVIDLNSSAMDAYNNLDVSKASSQLEKALQIAMQNGASGQLLVATYLNLGVVYVGGHGDRQKGHDYFLQAICMGPGIQLDPLVSTPDIQAVFQQAQQSANSGGCGATGMQQPAPPPPQPVGPQPVMPVQPVQPMQPMVAAGGATQIFHQPPVPQVSQAPLPIYAEVPAGTGVDRVYLHYLGLGMEAYRKVQMLPYGSGYAFQISCRDVWEPRVRYYLSAVDSSDRVLATSGTAQAPYEAQVVTSLQGAPGPAFPGAQSPGPCIEKECPPGLSGDECEKPMYSQIGEGCYSDKDCQPGLLCDDDVCVIPGSNMDGVDYDYPELEDRELGPTDFASGFFQLGFTMGISWVSAGMVATPPPDNAMVLFDPRYLPPNWDQLTAEQPNRYIAGGFNPDLAWVPDADSYDMRTMVDEEGNTVWDDEFQEPDASLVVFPGNECPGDGIVTGPLAKGGSGFGERPSRYCARVPDPGFVMAPALRVSVGYFVLPRFSLAGVLRFQFEAGEGSLANMLLGGRAEYMFFGGEDARGLGISGFLGATAGQIQVRPPVDNAQEGDVVPFIISGIGGAHIGASVRYRFHRNFGLVFSPEFDFQFPAVLMHFDLTLSAEVAAF